MDSKKFFGKIREIIREEIDYALDKKLANSNTKNDVVTEKKSRDAELIERAKSVVNTKNKSPKVTNQKYSNINDLLEETRRSLSENYMVDDDTIYMDSNSVDSFVSSRTSAAVPNGVSPNDVPQDIMNALTRNYSDLMKKIDEKKGR